MNFGMEVYSIAINKNNPDSIFIAARNKVLLLDFTPFVALEMPDSGEIKPPEGEEPPPDGQQPPPMPPDTGCPRLVQYFEGLPGEIIYDLHYDELVMTSSVGFFAIEGQRMHGPGPVAKRFANAKTPPAKIRALSVMHNRGDLQARFTLDRSEKVSMRLYSMQGKQIGELANGRYDKGTHYVRLTGDPLPSGNFLLRLSIPGQAIVQRFVIVH